MRLHIDGRFLTQDVTGVQKVAIEFVDTVDTLLATGELSGLEVVVWAPARGDLVTTPDYRAIRLRRAGRLRSHAWEQLELPRLTRGEPLLCLGNLTPAVALLGRRRRPVFTVVHDLSYAYFPAAYGRAFRALYGVVVPLALLRSSHVFTVSESERRSILQRHPRLIDERRLTAVQNGGGEGADQATPTSALESLQAGTVAVPDAGLRERRVLYVGSLTRRKNADGLARAAVELTRSTDVDVVLVGSTGASFEDAGIVVPAEVRDRIHFLGQVNDPARVEEEYRRAGVFVFPSHYEASPLPPVEAMRFGCPVVAADIPSLRERCGDAAAYCDPTDVSSIVGEVRRLLDDPVAWQHHQAAGLLRAADFSWRRQVEQVIGTVVGRSGAA